MVLRSLLNYLPEVESEVNNVSLLIFDLSRGEWDPTHPDTKVDFAKAKASGIVAAYFRDANGSFPDATAPTFEESADAVGMPWGDFGTVYPPGTQGTIQQQAQEFITNATTTHLGSMPLCVDWEVNGVTWNHIYQYIALVQKAIPNKEIIIYSRANFLKDNLPNPILQAASYKWFTQFDIWQAQYLTKQPDNLPNGFRRVMWQWTDRADASLYGINPLEAKGVDMSYFDGTLDQFNTRFGFLSTPPTVPVNDTGKPSEAPSTPTSTSDTVILKSVVVTVNGKDYNLGGS